MVDPINLPIYKTLLTQIENAQLIKTESNGNSQLSSLKTWLIDFAPKEESKSAFVEVTNIWIQGTIVCVVDNMNIVVSDGTGLAVVFGAKMGAGKFEVGNFVMVVGYITKAGSSMCDQLNNYEGPLKVFARLKAMKVTISNENTLFSKGIWWNKEVIEAQKHVVSCQEK